MAETEEWPGLDTEAKWEGLDEEWPGLDVDTSNRWADFEPSDFEKNAIASAGHLALGAAEAIPRGIAAFTETSSEELARLNREIKAREDALTAEKPDYLPLQQFEGPSLHNMKTRRDELLKEAGLDIDLQQTALRNLATQSADAIQGLKERLPGIMNVNPETAHSLASTAGRVTGNVAPMMAQPGLAIGAMTASTYADGADEAIQKAKEAGVTGKDLVEIGHEGGQTAVVKSLPVLAAYAAAGPVGGRVASAIAPDAGPVLSGTIAGATGAAANSLVSAADRAATGEDVVPTGEQLLTDVAFGAVGGLHAGQHVAAKNKAIGVVHQSMAEIDAGPGSPQYKEKAKDFVLQGIKDPKLRSQIRARYDAAIRADAVKMQTKQLAPDSPTAAVVEGTSEELSDTAIEAELMREQAEAERQLAEIELEKQEEAEAAAKEEGKPTPKKKEKKRAVQKTEPEPISEPVGEDIYTEAGGPVLRDERVSNPAEVVKGFPEDDAAFEEELLGKPLKRAYETLNPAPEPAPETPPPAEPLPQEPTQAAPPVTAPAEPVVKETVVAPEMPVRLQNIAEDHGLEFNGEHMGRLMFSPKDKTGPLGGTTFTLPPDANGNEFLAKIKEVTERMGGTPEQLQAAAEIAKQKAAREAAATAPAPAPEPVKNRFAPDDPNFIKNTPEHQKKLETEFFALPKGAQAVILKSQAEAAEHILRLQKLSRTSTLESDREELAKADSWIDFWKKAGTDIQAEHVKYEAINSEFRDKTAPPEETKPPVSEPVPPPAAATEAPPPPPQPKPAPAPELSEPAAQAPETQPRPKRAPVTQQRKAMVDEYFGKQENIDEVEALAAAAIATEHLTGVDAAEIVSEVYQTALSRASINSPDKIAKAVWNIVRDIARKHRRAQEIETPETEAITAQAAAPEPAAPETPTQTGVFARFRSILPKEEQGHFDRLLTRATRKDAGAPVEYRAMTPGEKAVKLKLEAYVKGQRKAATDSERAEITDRAYEAYTVDGRLTSQQFKDIRMRIEDAETKGDLDQIRYEVDKAEKPKPQHSQGGSVTVGGSPLLQPGGVRRVMDVTDTYGFNQADPKRVLARAEVETPDDMLKVALRFLRELIHPDTLFSTDLGLHREKSAGFWEGPRRIKINPFEDNRTIEETIAHEALHDITQEMIDQWHAKDARLSPEAHAAIDKLEALRQHALSYSPKAFRKILSAKRNAGLTDFYDAVKAHGETMFDPSGLSQEVGHLYGLTSVGEFMSEMFTNERFRKFLRSHYIKAEGGKLRSLWEQAKQYLFSAFGANPGDLLYRGLEHTMELLQARENPRRPTVMRASAIGGTPRYSPSRSRGPTRTRRSAENILSNEAFSERIKAVVRNNATYRTQSSDEASQKAQVIWDTEPTIQDALDRFQNDNSLDGGVRARGMIDALKYLGTAEKLLPKEEAEKMAGLSEQLTKTLLEQGTSTGRFVQGLTELQTPLTWVRSYEKPIGEAQAKELTAHPIARELKKAIIEGTEEAVSTAIEKKKGLLERAEKTRETQQKVSAFKSNKSIWEQYSDAIAKQVKAFTDPEDPKATGAIQDFAKAVGKAVRDKARELIPAPEMEEVAKPSATQTINDLLRNSEHVRTTFETAQRELFKNSSNPKIGQFLQAILETPFSREQLKAYAKENNMPLSDLIKEHYTKVDETGRTLAEKMIADGGIQGTNAIALAKSVAADVKKIVADKRGKELEALVARAGKKPKPHEVKQTVDKILDMINLGAFDHPRFYNAIADRFGLPSFDPKVSQSIKERADRMHMMPEGSRIRAKAASDLLDFIRNHSPTGILDTTRSYQTANILTQLGTHVYVPFVNTMMTIPDVMLMIGMKPRHAGKLLDQFKRMYKDTAWGNTSWHELTQVLKGDFSSAMRNDAIFQGGESTAVERAQKAHEEGIPFKVSIFGKELPQGVSEKLGAIRHLRFAGRMVAAWDSLTRHAATEVKMVRDVISQLEKDPDWKKMTAEEQNNAIDRALYIDDGSIQSATAIARQEAVEHGYTPEQEKQRILDIIRSRRDNVLQSAAEEYGKFVTGSGEWQGSVGALAHGISQGVQKLPIFDIAGVKFLRTAQSVYNIFADWSPIYSLKRLLVGSGRSFKGTKWDRYYQPPGERTKGSLFGDATWDKQLGKVVISHGMTALLVGLVHAFEDDKDPAFTITGNGPDDPAVRRMWIENHGKEDSIKIGRQYYSFKGLPIAPLLHAIGNYADSRRYGNQEQSTEQALKTLGWGLISIPATIASQDLMRGLNTLIDVGSELFSPKHGSAHGFAQATSRWLSNMITSLTPGGPLVKSNIERALLSPRAANGTVEKFIRSVPIASFGLKPDLDAFGHEVTAGWPERVPAASRFVSIEGDDPVIQHMIQNGIGVRWPENQKVIKFVDGEPQIDEKTGLPIPVEMTPQQHYYWVAKYGPLIYDAIKEKLPDWEGIPPEEAKREAQDIIEYYQRMGVDELSIYPENAKEVDDVLEKSPKVASNETYPRPAQPTYGEGNIPLEQFVPRPEKGPGASLLPISGPLLRPEEYADDSELMLA